MNHYETLGVSHDATDEEIKKAYRKLARVLHPDVNGTEDATEKIKAVTHAYEVLSNPRKRRNYDRYGDENANVSAGGEGFQAGFGFEDIFSSFFGGASSMPEPASRTRKGQDSLLVIRIDLYEAVFGAEKTVEVNTAVVCETCGGSCCEPGTHPVPCEICQGSGRVQREVRSLLGTMLAAAACPKCQGFGTIIENPCRECRGEGRMRQKRSLTFQVPAGVGNGTRIKLDGQGEIGPAGGAAGDLYVEIKVAKHKTFARDGDDLLATLNVPFTVAALGSAFTIETFDGPREVDIRQGTQNDDVVTLRGLGVPRLRGIGRGDLKIRIQVQTPVKLDEEQQQLLERLAALRSEEPHIVSLTDNTSFIGKIKDFLK